MFVCKRGIYDEQRRPRPDWAFWCSCCPREPFRDVNINVISTSRRQLWRCSTVCALRILRQDDTVSMTVRSQLEV